MKISPCNNQYDPPELEGIFNGGQRFAVYLNGEYATEVLSADDRAGVIQKIVDPRDPAPRGGIVEMEGELLVETFRGLVEIVPSYEFEGLLANLDRLTAEVPQS